jgi:hypothetical protein
MKNIYNTALLVVAMLCVGSFVNEIEAKNAFQKFAKEVRQNPRPYKKKLNIVLGISGITLATAVGVLVHAKKKVRHITKKLQGLTGVADVVSVFSPKKVSRLKKSLKRYKALRDFAATIVALSTVATATTLGGRLILNTVPEPTLSQQVQGAVERGQNRMIRWFHGWFAKK